MRETGSRVWEAMQPYSAGGVYVNYFGRETDEASDGLRPDVVSGGINGWIAQIFWLNQNIKPTA
jgi:hypothetical protein